MQEFERNYNQMPSATPMWHGVPFSQVCRLCANSSDYLIPVFSGDGIDHQLQLKISFHLHIEILEDDHLPTQICYPCASTLLAFHDMKENSLEAEKRLNSVLCSNRQKNLRRPDELFFTSQCTEEIHSSDVGGNIPEKGSLEEDPYKYKQPVKKRLLVDSEKSCNGDMVDKCPKQSGKGYELLGNNSNQETHLSNIKDLSDRKKKKKKRERLSKCSICGKVFHFIEYLKSHMLSHSDSRPHLCHICGASFKRKDHVNHHRRTVHVNHPDVLRELEEKGEEPITCDDCGEVKPTRHAMFLHKKRHNVNSVCDVCNQSFILPSLLKAHMLKVHVDDVFPCNVCGEMQKSGHALYIHKKKHSSNYICDVCGKSFTQPSSLRTHMVIHSDEKPYTCDECGKSFKLKVRLHLHKQSHRNLRPFACNICENKCFKTKSALLVHNYMHNDTRPYPCPHCNFRARKNSDLVCHIRTHTGEKPYKCELCGRGFAQAGVMRKHRATHDRQKPEQM